MKQVILFFSFFNLVGNLIAQQPQPAEIVQTFYQGMRITVLLWH